MSYTAYAETLQTEKRDITTQSFNEKLIKHLNDLIQLDTDAIEAYEQALKHIDSPEIHNKISRFIDDHRQHIVTLSALVEQYGGEPVEQKKDFKGFIMKGITSLRSTLGEKAAVQALKSNTEWVNKIYGDILEENFPTQVRRVLEKNYQDKQRHLRYIELLSSTY